MNLKLTDFYHPNQLFIKMNIIMMLFVLEVNIINLLNLMPKYIILLLFNNIIIIMDIIIIIILHLIMKFLDFI